MLLCILVCVINYDISQKFYQFRILRYLTFKVIVNSLLKYFTINFELTFCRDIFFIAQGLLCILMVWEQWCNVCLLFLFFSTVSTTRLHILGFLFHGIHKYHNIHRSILVIPLDAGLAFHAKVVVEGQVWLLLIHQ